MTKNSRLSFAVAIIILLAGATLRLWALIDVPLGYNEQEVIDLRLAETVRQGSVRVFFDLGDEGREVLYPAVIAAATSILGTGTVIYTLLSVIVGMITLALTFALARRLYGDLAGLAALGFMAVAWWPVLLSRMVGRETLLPMLTTVVLLALALGLPVYGRLRTTTSQTTAFVILGVALSLGIYLHPVGLVVGLMALVFIGYYMAFGRPRLTDSLRRTIGFTVLLVLIFIVPYLLSAVNMPALSGAMRLFGGLSADDTPLVARALSAFLSVGLRGDASPVYNIPGRPLIDPVSATLMGAGGLIALRFVRRRLRFTMLAFALVILAPLALFAPFSPSWLAASVVLPVLALCFGLGVTAVATVTKRTVFTGALLAVLIAFNGIWTVHDLFTIWPAMPDVQLAYRSRIAALAQHVDSTATAIPTMVCSSEVSLTQRRASTDFTSARLFTLMLNNHSIKLRYLDCASSMIFPRGGERMQVVLPNLSVLNATSPAVLQWLDLGESDGSGLYALSVVGPLADRTGLFTTSGAPVRFEPEVAPRATTVLPPIRLENNLTFLGYEPLVTSIEPGGILSVVTYWRVDGVLPPDLVLFAHLYDDLGAAPLANQDSISVVPSQLESRDVFVQVHFIQIPSTLPQRQYDIAVGAYRTQSRQRLHILAEPELTPTGSRLILYPVEVTANP